MLNKFTIKNSKTAINILTRNFATAAKAAPAQGDNMSKRFHDIYVKELEKLQNTK